NLCRRNPAALRGAPLQRIDNVAVAVFQRLSFRSDSTVAQETAAILFAKGDGYVQEADTRSVRANHVFRRIGVALNASKPIRRFRQLALQIAGIAACGHLLL